MPTTKNKKAGDGSDHHPLWVKTATYPTPPAEFATLSRMEGYMGLGIQTGVSIQMYGGHGMGKSATAEFNGPAVAAAHGHQNATVVVLNAANIGPDDMLSVVPFRDREAAAQLLLRELIMKELSPGRPFILVIDDSLQAGEMIQNQFMQITASWELGTFDLRELGCIGVVLLDNEALVETAARRTDLAHLDRVATFELSANDTPWRLALAAQFPDVDLAPVFAAWSSQIPAIRQIITPRTLEHMISLSQAGLPIRRCLPIINGEYAVLSAANGDDRTEEVLDQFATALHVSNLDHVPNETERLLEWAFSGTTCRKILIQGKPGRGKTKLTQALAAKHGLTSLTYSMAVTDVDQLCAPIPLEDGTLEVIINEKFRTPEPKVLIWDEYNRPKDQFTFAKLMEVTQRGSLGGVAITNVRAQVALQNPPSFLGRKMMVRRNNLAQADRFDASLILANDTDIPAFAWLIDTYPASFPGREAEVRTVAEIVVDWWKLDLDDDGREWISARNLQRIIDFHLAGYPVENTKIYLGEGQFAPVPMAALEARLADRPMAGLREIAANIDEWEDKLREADDRSGAGNEASDAVHTALSNAELSQLIEHRAAVVRMLKLLPARLKVTYLVSAGREREEYWSDAIGRASGRIKDTDPAPSCGIA